MVELIQEVENSYAWKKEPVKLKVSDQPATMFNNHHAQAAKPKAKAKAKGAPRRKRK